MVIEFVLYLYSLIHFVLKKYKSFFLMSNRDLIIIIFFTSLRFAHTHKKKERIYSLSNFNAKLFYFLFFHNKFAKDKGNVK